MARNKYLNKQDLELFHSVGGIFNEEQMSIINQRTPPDEIEEKIENGVKYKTVKSDYVKKLVTIVTGGNYNFKIKDQVFLSGSKEVKTNARLTIFVGGKKYFRDQVGKSKCNIPNADSFKASASDAFKKCASEFGFCWDIYTSENQEVIIEEKKLSYEDQKIVDKFKKAIERCETPDDIDFELEKLQDNISNQEILDICQEIVNNHNLK